MLCMYWVLCMLSCGGNKFLLAKLFSHLFLSLSLLLCPSPSVSFSLLSVKRQAARSFTLSDSAMHPAGQRLDDVIWAKGCVNTAVTLVLDLSIGLGWRTEKRIVWD